MRILPLTEENKTGLLNSLLKRSPNHYAAYMDTVNAIVERVRREGDLALADYTRQFDQYEISPGQFLATQEEIDEAYRQADEAFLAVRANRSAVIMKSSAATAGLTRRPAARSWGRRSRPCRGSACMCPAARRPTRLRC